jgi:hypothetical protein|uniref:Uncharacterized protein n=1 Tax=uncultured prokaryote TaxID=198431 RepID=A0A0H5Q1T4_9ZZZZ|nr:hypothetical protein [uncultured prokaryote]
MAGQLISDPKERAERAAEKEQFVLEWLADFVYSTTDVLGVVLELKPSATLSALRRLERKGYIVRDEILVYGRIVLPIWGITMTGLMAYLTPQQIETQKLRYHQKGRVALSSLQHEMDVQRVAIFCERSKKYDSEEWTTNRDLPWPSKKSDPRWPVYPDGLMHLPINGDKNNLAEIAVEVERTRKTPKRYVQILKGHAANIAQGRYHGVIYFCVDQQAVESLKALFKRIFKEENITFTSPKIRAMIGFEVIPS